MLPIHRSKKQAQRYYNRISGIYDWLTAGEKNLIRNGVELLAPKPGENILEIGCGTGTGLKWIAEALSGSGQVIGLDLSYQMLIKSQGKSRQLKPEPALILGDGAKLPLQNDYFDAIFCAFTLELFPKDEMMIVMEEFSRVLKRPGRIAVMALSREPYNLPVRIYEFAHQQFPVALDCRPIPLVEILTKCGIEITRTQKIMNWGLPVDLISGTISH